MPLVLLTGESNHMLSIMRINALHFVIMPHLFTRLSSESSGDRAEALGVCGEAPFLP